MKFGFSIFGFKPLRVWVNEHNDRLDSQLGWLKSISAEVDKLKSIRADISSDIEKMKQEVAYFSSSIDRVRADVYFGSLSENIWYEAGFCVDLHIPDTAIVLPICGPSTAMSLFSAVRAGHGHYELALIRAFASLSNPPAKILVLGAGVGELALQIATIYRTSHLLAVESDATLSRHLSNNVKVNALDDRITVVDEFDFGPRAFDCVLITSSHWLRKFGDQTNLIPSTLSISIDRPSEGDLASTRELTKRFDRVEMIEGKLGAPDETGVEAQAALESTRRCRLVASSHKTRT